MPCKYELQYFPIMGRAEPIRLMFAEAGVEYEDKRITPEQWAKHKAETPLGQMPVLIVDGKHKIAQSGAIVRYLSRELNLCGKSGVQQAYVDMLAETFGDIASKLPLMEKDETKKRELMKAAIEKTIGPLFTAIETKYNKYGGDFLVGESVTYADICLMQIANVVEYFEKDYVQKNFPKLSALRDRVAARKGIAAWIKKRPNTGI